jgi:two-component sensor histidine kinase
VGDIAIGLEQSIPCGLILNEMMTNAIKHAFPADRGGKIWIQMALEDMAIRLLFKDNGIGFPATFDWRKSPSLGIRLIQILSNCLSASKIRNNFQFWGNTLSPSFTPSILPQA